MDEVRDPGVERGDALGLYRRLIEDSGVGLFQTTRDGEIRWVNAAAARIVGYETPADFMSSVADIREIYVDPSRREDFEREIATHGRVSGFEYEIIRKDGALRWIEVSARPITAPDGSVEVFEGTVRDVTDRKLLTAALDAVSSGLDPSDAVSRFAYVLSRVISFQQLSLAVLEGEQHYRRVISLAGPGEEIAFLRGERVPLAGNSMQAAVDGRRPVVVADTAAGEWEFDRVLRGRGIRSYAIFPLIDESGVFATFNVGVAEAHSLTDDVVSLLASITSPLGNAVKNILVLEREREAHRSLAEASMLKNEFLARASHDLRSPLSIIDGVAEILYEHWDAMDDEGRRQKVEVIKRQSGRMKELLRRDLDIALIEAGDLVCELRSFDLARSLGEAVHDAATAHPDYHFEVTIPPDLPPAYADDERTLQVFANLLTNAIKFSDPGTTIRIRAERDHEFLRVEVQDEGSGIDEDRLEEIFERMSRLDGGTEGTGLGLYIARSLVELQGGRIWATSSTGEGSCFSFTLPVDEQASS